MQMRTILILTALWTMIHAKCKIEDIEGNIFLEESDKVHLFHETWNLIISVNASTIENRLKSIHNLLRITEDTCDSKCVAIFEIRIIKQRFQRLKSKGIILEKLLGNNRSKRGLANFVGDISKTLFGTLTESDLKLINSDMDTLFKDNSKLASIIGNHTKILKMILDSSSTSYQMSLAQEDKERSIARNLSTGINKNLQENYINSKLLLITLLIDELNEDIDTLMNAINSGKHGIVHPQILTPTILKDTIKEFENIKRTRYHFDNTEDNYQHLIDISTLTAVARKGNLIYIIKLPILEPEEGVLTRIIPIPP